MSKPVAAILGIALFAGTVLAVPPKSDKNIRLTNEEWKGVSTSPLQPGEIDALIAKEQAAAKVTPSPKTSDEHFLRRVMLDLTGQLPLPADITEFAADKDANKRAKMIDQLLASDDYAKHWARYWRDVFAAKVTDRLAQGMVVHFEAWLTEQFRENRHWDAMAKEILTSKGQIPSSVSSFLPPRSAKCMVSVYWPRYRRSFGIRQTKRWVPGVRSMARSESSVSRWTIGCSRSFCI